jgi:hypothetical protein
MLDHIVRDKTLRPIEMVLTVVDWHATWHLRGLGDGSPCWFYEGVHSEGIDDLLAQIALVYPNLFLEHLQNSEFKEYITYHRQVKTFQVIAFHVNEGGEISIRIRVTADLASYDKGRWCRCIPIPGKRPKIARMGKEPLSVNSPEVVLAGPLVEADLRRLSQVWQDRFAKSVLLCGPPGSGKDHFAYSLPYGSGRKTDNIQPLSLAESDSEQTLKRLFGWRRNDGTIQEGLIARAKDSAVFVDEAHYPEDGPGARASLLRTLEANTYYPMGSDEIEEVQNVLWVFASSRGLTGPKSIGDLEPPDFWTRMSHVVPVHHPLDASALEHLEGQLSPVLEGEQANSFDKAFLECEVEIQGQAKATSHQIVLSQRLALGRFFRFFWISRLEEYFWQEIINVPPPEDISNQTPDQIVVDRKLRRLLIDKEMELMAVEFANFFMQTVGSSSLHEISVRGLRAMVGQLLSHAIQEIEGPREVNLVQMVRDCLPDIFKQMQQMASLSAKS